MSVHGSEPKYDPYTETPEDETRFKCACGNPSCYGHNDDPANVQSGGRWYSADCRNLPLEVQEERERASQADVARDDAMNWIRR